MSAGDVAPLTEADVAAALAEHADCTLNTGQDLGAEVTGVDVWSCGLTLPFSPVLEDAERAHVASVLVGVVAALLAAERERLRALVADLLDATEGHNADWPEAIDGYTRCTACRFPAPCPTTLARDALTRTRGPGMMAPLKPHNRHAVCPKCGGTFVSVTYAAPVEVCDTCRCRASRTIEHLDRTCQTCRYSWPEATEDSAR